jgi:hypothetical protein
MLVHYGSLINPEELSVQIRVITNYTYGTRVAFYASPVVNQTNEDEHYNHHDLNHRKPVLRLSFKIDDITLVQCRAIKTIP